MDNFNLNDFTDLPQTQDTWFLAVRKMRTWVKNDDGSIIRPNMTVILNLDIGLIRDVKMVPEPAPQEVLETLFAAMQKTEKTFGFQPERPARVFLEDKNMLEALRPTLEEIGVEARWRTKIQEIDDILAELEENMQEDAPEFPGLLKQQNVKPRLVGGLFASAANFYRAAPWVQLSNDDLLAITIPPQKEPYYVIVMGQGGVEYGLALCKSWQAVLRQYGPYDRPEDMFTEEGRHVMFFTENIEVPFDDLDDQETYGWELPEADIYPVPLIFYAVDKVRRPDKDEIQWYEAALRAIPRFVQEHLTLDEASRPQPAEARIKVATSSGNVTVTIKFPGGEMPVDRGTPLEDFLLEGDESPEMPFDRRGMEGDMARFTGDFGESGVDSKVAQAQEMMYDAWEQDNPARRIVLAHKALSISPDCADAYVLLAEEEADTRARALELFQQGVEAGRRALGEDYFEENSGHFWGLLETRPYMRAMEGKATCLWQLKHYEESLETYQEMLRLNPGDNQGMRYVLADLLMSLNRDSEMEKLIQQYPDDWSAVWLYTQALLAFRQSGASASANHKLESALSQNQFVPDYLTGAKRLPNRLPAYIGIGNDNEAVDYAGNHLNYWRRTPAAIEWLGERLAKAPPPAADTAKPKRRKGKGGLKLGDSVVVKPEVTAPDSPTDLSGWQGRVEEFDESDEGPLALILWDSITLTELSPAYIEQSEQQGLAWDRINLLEDELLPAESRDTPEEREVVYMEISNQYTWAFLGEQGQRIQSVLGDIDEDDETAALEAWENHVRRHLKFPFEAIVAEYPVYEELEPGERIEVLGIKGIDENFGILMLVEAGDSIGIVPLMGMEVGEQDTTNFQYIDDYITWFMEG